jgi:hypothetical protein
VIEKRRAERRFGDGLIAAEVGDRHEGWMRHADRLLADPDIVAAIYEALAKRHPQRCYWAGGGDVATSSLDQPMECRDAPAE